MLTTIADVGHWHADEATLPTHFLVRSSVFYGRAACGVVIHPGEQNDDRLDARCPECTDAVTSASETLPSEVDDARAHVVARLLTVLDARSPRPAWREVKPGVRIAEYVDDEELARASGRRLFGRVRARSSKGSRMTSEPTSEATVETSTDSPAPAPAADAQESTVTAPAAPKTAKTPKAAKPAAKSTTKPTGKAVTKPSTNGHDVKATAPRTPKAAAKPAAAPAPVAPAATGSSKDLYEVWKKENAKLLAMNASDPKREKQYQTMRAASRAYRAAKAAEKAAK